MSLRSGAPGSPTSCSGTTAPARARTFHGGLDPKTEQSVSGPHPDGAPGIGVEPATRPRHSDSGGDSLGDGQLRTGVSPRRGPGLARPSATRERACRRAPSGTLRREPRRGRGRRRAATPTRRDTARRYAPVGLTTRNAPASWSSSTSGRRRDGRAWVPATLATTRSSSTASGSRGIGCRRYLPTSA